MKYIQDVGVQILSEKQSLQRRAVFLHLFVMLQSKHTRHQLFAKTQDK